MCVCRRCLSELPDCSDGSAVQRAAQLLGAEGRTQRSLGTDGRVAGAATEFLGEKHLAVKLVVLVHRVFIRVTQCDSDNI